MTSKRRWKELKQQICNWKEKTKKFGKTNKTGGKNNLDRKRPAEKPSYPREGGG